jgi:hypothetical protein
MTIDRESPYLNAPNLEIEPPHDPSPIGVLEAEKIKELQAKLAKDERHGPAKEKANDQPREGSYEQCQGIIRCDPDEGSQ